jgi:hypothetical protein
LERTGHGKSLHENTGDFGELKIEK